jgi:3-deoxy-manno-octulosonate cytidylyltransferase (CMP-KDO synthetase)
MKIIGIVPARMAASRFPGKPLAPINGRPLIEHCFERARLFPSWDGLFLATCDKEIEEFGKSKGYPIIWTSNTHVRALDRVAEAAENCGLDLDENDIVLNVQGDEPMLHPEMIEAAVQPLLKQNHTGGTIVAIDIIEESQYRDPNILKIIHDHEGRVLYTSRAPLPFCEPGEFTLALGAKRIFGIFGFRLKFLRLFTQLAPSHLEKTENCDSNRLLDHGYHQYIAQFKYRPSYSVDCPDDVLKVEQLLANDELVQKY